MSDQFYVGLDVTAFENGGKYKPISRVTLLADDENAYTAGDDTGMELTASCAHATQAMADSILAAVKGYRYQAFSADAANLDPAAELGDGVTAGGVYAVLSRLSDDGEGFVDLSAPGEMELEEEYPSSGPMTQEFNRKLAETRSRITKTAEEILLQVEAADGRVSSLSVSVDGIAAKVQGLEGSVSSIQQLVDSITLSVSNGSTSSTIKLMAGTAEIASQTISMSGLVTFAGLSSGTTTIDGACIKTGTIQAQRLNLTGAISWGDLDSSVQSNVNGAYSMASAAQSTVSGWVYGGSTYIDGTKIMAGTVSASTLRGGEIQLLNSSGNTYGSMQIGNSSTGYAVDLDADGSMRLTARNRLYLEGYNGTHILIDSGIINMSTIGAAGSGVSECGTSAYKWKDVWAVNGMIQTSDRTEKNTIRYDIGSYDTLFDRLRPASFKFNAGTSGRTHLGMIAQDVEAALEHVGIDTTDFAGFIKYQKENEAGNARAEYGYGLRYEEFIPLCIDQIQKLKARVAALEGAAV